MKKKIVNNKQANKGAKKIITRSRISIVKVKKVVKPVTQKRATALVSKRLVNPVRKEAFPRGVLGKDKMVTANPRTPLGSRRVVTPRARIEWANPAVSRETFSNGVKKIVRRKRISGRRALVLTKKWEKVPVRVSTTPVFVHLVKKERVSSPFDFWPIFYAFRSILAVFLIVSLAGGSLASVGDTFSTFNDEESSGGNNFLSGEVDFTATSTPWDPIVVSLNMEPGSTTVKKLGINPLQSNPFQYFASTTITGGDEVFCAGIETEFKQNLTTLYNGPLSNLNTPTTTTFEDFSLSATTGVNNFQNKICHFGIDFNGWQTRHGFPTIGGFSDTENATATLESWGFRINKVYYDVEEGSEEPNPKQCEARSQGYWKNNQGCSNGTGSSPWASDVNTLSSGFSSVFSSSSGGDVCALLDTSSCPSGGTVAGQRCRAKSHTLADELNVVSGKLDLNAIIAGADNGDSSFDALGLLPSSTISESLSAVEVVISNGSSTKDELEDAAYVAQRVYAFYENENPNAPMCMYGVNDSPGRGKEGKNEWIEVYNQTNVPLDISGWQICDGEACDTIPTSPTVPAKGYAMITNDGGTASATGTAPWYLPAEVVYIPLWENIGDGLGNDADMLVLKRPDGVIVDQMNWGIPDLGWPNFNSDVWNPGVPGVAEGNLLTRKPNGYDTNQPSDWVEIAPPSIDLIYPDEAGSYSWYWTYSYTIKWSATNNNGPDSDLNIDIFYIKDTDHNGVITPTDTMDTIVLDTDNDGAYKWKVPSGFLGYIWVKIVVTGPENPLNNTRGISASVYDPEPIVILPPGETLESVDLTPPVIEIQGNNPAAVKMGSAYSDLGANVTDNVTVNLGLKVTGDEIDTSVPGVHEVIYEAVDKMGNTAIAKRIVVVYDEALGEPDLTQYLASLLNINNENSEEATSTETVVETNKTNGTGGGESPVLPDPIEEEKKLEDEQAILPKEEQDGGVETPDGTPPLEPVKESTTEVIEETKVVSIAEEVVVENVEEVVTEAIQEPVANTEIVSETAIEIVKEPVTIPESVSEEVSE